jgi:small subunit ribosomal protein S15
MSVWRRIAARGRSSSFIEVGHRLLATTTNTNTNTIVVDKIRASGLPAAASASLFTTTSTISISTTTTTNETNNYLLRGGRRFVSSTPTSFSSTDGEVLNLGRRGGSGHRGEDAQSSASSDSSSTREMVRKFKGVETASKAELNKIELDRVRKEFATWSADSGSSGVQIAALTAKIAYMTEHLKVHKKDKHSRLGLSQMLERRKKLLKYLRRRNATTYLDVITRLGLKDRSFVEEPLGAKWPTRGG